MNFAARCIASSAVALLLTAALFADDDAKPKAGAKNDDASASGSASPVAAQPDANPPAPALSPTGSLPFATNALPAAAMHPWDESQDYPKVEWFLGYSFWRAMPTSSSNRIGYLHGGSTSVAYNFNRYLGLVADFAGFDDSRLTLFNPAGSQTFDASGSAYTFAFGPRFSYRRHEKFTPFIQALFGGAHASSVTISGCSGNPACTPLGSDTAFTTLLGAGFDVKLNRHIALRLFEGDFLLTHFKNPTSTTGQDRGWQDNARFSTGIVFRFGGNPAPPPRAPMTASCSALPETVYAGSDASVAIRADAANPGPYSLHYSWSASDGAIDGTGPEVRWISSNKQPGTYTITASVDNGRSGTARCSVNIRVLPRPNRPPTISCSASRYDVTVGDRVAITATASDPDNDPLSFSWNASGGQIEGSGSSANFQTAGLPPGAYAITGHVDDGRAGTADCALNIDVRPAQVPAEVQQLETRLALHSIYFATARPTAQNPTGGLVESQQQVLLSLAIDFNRYLTFKPQAHLVLEGHADHRGSVPYNQVLTERRVERTKSFLVEHGVPAANIETRAVGEQDNLDAAQVKNLIAENPDLSSDERQRIESNLQVIVWANNRRVDVSLDTTGQQSVRRYPFNAKDALKLLSPKDRPSAKPSVRDSPTRP